MLEAERQAGDSQSRKVRGNLGPREGILHQTVSRLPVANQVFLGPWTVDIARRVAVRDQLPRGDTRHTRERSPCAPRKPRGWERGDGKMHRPPGRVHLVT